MKLWTVRVKCCSNEARTCWMTALVEADDSMEAMREGRAYVESKAPTDILWTEFIAMEAATVALPMLLV